MATKQKRMVCVPCKQLVDCGALIVAADQFADSFTAPSSPAIAARGMARYIERFIVAYQLMEDKGLTKNYGEEAAKYSQEACDFARRLDDFRVGKEGVAAPTVANFDYYKHELIEFGQKLAGYGPSE